LNAEPRISADALRVLGAMLEDPLAWHYGLRLSQDAEIASGTIYPMLARLENAKWLESCWEARSPDNEGRPPRRLYKLTGLGERKATEHLEEIARLAGRVKRRKRGAALRPGEELA